MAAVRVVDKPATPPQLPSKAAKAVACLSDQLEKGYGELVRAAAGNLSRVVPAIMYVCVGVVNSKAIAAAHEHGIAAAVLLDQFARSQWTATNEMVAELEACVADFIDQFRCGPRVKPRG